jgi:hypothetical protein
VAEFINNDLQPGLLLAIVTCEVYPIPQKTHPDVRLHDRHWEPRDEIICSELSCHVILLALI